MSRCQQYNFKRMTSELVVDQLKMILNKEGRSIDERGLDHIAFLSEGSMRDAISLTNTVLSFSTNQHVDYDQVLRALQETSATDCDALVREINDGKSGEAIRIAKNMLESGITEEHLTADILRYLRDLLFINGENGIEIHASDTQRTAMEAIAAIIGEKKITAMMLPFHDVLKEIRFLSSKELALEMAIMQASSRSEIEMYREVEERLSKLEDIMKN